ncbi:MAG: acetolactate synthase small subunit [Flavobacteriaceae bacterium]|nr:acetolactate synthase small subunit [Flavobacteriaceae bacterium]
MKKQFFTLSIYTENKVGLLNRVTSIFLRRHINIESLTVSESEIKDAHRFTLVVKTSEEQIKKIVGQLEKQVEVIKAYYHTADETIFQEIALYKIATENLYEGNLQGIIKQHYASIVEVNKEFIVVEKSGDYESTQQLYNELRPYGMLQFVRSGRIAVTKPKMNISGILNQ